MPSEFSDTLEQTEEESTELATDPRWQLVNRILLSRTMQRATHLQKILAFASEEAILHPGWPIREQDIAQKVLGRSDDFDPAYDTIVRVQVGHLRNKLHKYFANEGAGEPLRLTIPKGSYLPIFEPASTRVEVDSENAFPLAASTAVSIPADTSGNANSHKSLLHRGWLWGSLVLLLVCSVGILALWKFRYVQPAEEPSTLARLFPFSAQNGGKVTVVLPDTSLLLIQKLLGLQIPLEAYTHASYPENLGLQAKDRELQRALRLLGDVRTTTLDEAEVGMDFIQALNKTGLQGDLRYARDIHIRDLGEGNYILIGNQRSDPWVTLFAGRNNFQLVGNPSGIVENQSDHSGSPAGLHYVFKNMHPAPGESTQYVPFDTPQETTNFVDLTLTPNLTDSGYVLLIIGYDVPANEAAARFLLGGDLPEDIKSKLGQQNLRSIEILLRGHHFHGQSNDKLAIVAYRVTQR